MSPAVQDPSGLLLIPAPASRVAAAAESGESNRSPSRVYERSEFAAKKSSSTCTDRIERSDEIVHESSPVELEGDPLTDGGRLVPGLVHVEQQLEHRRARVRLTVEAVARRRRLWSTDESNVVV